MEILAITLWIGAGLGAIIVTVVARILAEDAKTFIPRMAAQIIRRASARIHEDHALELREEWLAHLDEKPEISGKLWHAVSIYLWGAGRICRAVGHSSHRPMSYYFAKRTFDIMFVVVCLPSLIPMIAVAALIIAFRGGTPFYSQMRVGRGGTSFRMWKLHTMVPNANEVLEQYLEDNPAAADEWNEKQKLENDPRITDVGRFLRKTSLDELPQMWNVLTGEMSLVGPRPMMTEQQTLYPRKEYFDMRPGLTGLWQVSDAWKTSRFADRAEFDADYYKRRSFLTDCKILLKTVIVVLRCTGR